MPSSVADTVRDVLSDRSMIEYKIKKRNKTLLVLLIARHYPRIMHKPITKNILRDN